MQKFKHLEKLTCYYKNNYTSFYLCRYFSNKENVEDKELHAFEKVESALFENNKHRPVNSENLLKEYRKAEETTKTKFIARQRNFIKQTQSSTLKDIVNKNNSSISYTKLKLNDPLLSKIFLSASASRSRKKNNQNIQVVTEGWRLIQEAINCGLTLKTLLFSKSENLESILDSIKGIKGAKIYKVPQETLRTWSTLTTSPGLIGVFERPSNHMNKYNDIDGERRLLYPITVICDNIREPNNLGSIIRTCAAIPCYEVLIMKGCCDPWEAKALRGGCGGQFQINIKDEIKWEDLIDSLPERNFSIFVAENNLEKAKNYPLSSYTDVKISSGHNYVIIGGETEGISEDAYRFMMHTGSNGSCIHIPLAKGVDSLNTSSALTLILFEMRKNLQLMIDEEKREQKVEIEMCK